MEGWVGLAVTDMPRPLTTCTDRSPGVTGSAVTMMSHLPRTPSHCSDMTLDIERERESERDLEDDILLSKTSN